MYAEPDFFYERFGKAVDERLANDRLPNVVRLDKPLNEMGLEPNSLDGAVAFMVLRLLLAVEDVPDVLKDVHRR